MLYAGNIDDGKERIIKNITRYVTSLIDNREKRFKMSNKMTYLIDGLGAKRIVKNILEDEKMLTIHQPNYWAYPGLIGKIMRSDKFLFLTKVQFDKSSWQNRNRIRVKRGGNIFPFRLKIREKKDS